MPMAETCERCGRPVLFPLSERDGVKRHVVSARVVHQFYGCDTGCCGHVVYGDDCDGNEVWSSHFHFDHPYGDDKVTWARSLAAEDLPEVPLNEADSEIHDD